MSAGAGHPFEPLRSTELGEDEMLRRAELLYAQLDERRSVRFFDRRPVPRRLIELAIATASTAPSGAHRQPWRFVAVADPAVKAQIRARAEEEERTNYLGGRMPEEWLAAVAPLGTDWRKPFLDDAPWLVVVFEQLYSLGADGQKEKNYYVKESVGIACGLFITALHHMGLATLTHTPSPMKFLSEVLGRPANEKAFILFPVGFPAPDAVVPVLRRKALDQVAEFVTAEGAG